MIKLTIPGIPPSLNRWSRLHWTKQRIIKNEWRLVVWVSVYTAKATKLNLQRAKVRITYYFSTIRRRDKDNYAPKQIMDGLVKAGVLSDDSADKIDLDWDFGRADTERTDIVIEEVEDGQAT